MTADSSKPIIHDCKLQFVMVRDDWAAAFAVLAYDKLRFYAVRQREPDDRGFGWWARGARLGILTGLRAAASTPIDVPFEYRIIKVIHPERDVLEEQLCKYPPTATNLNEHMRRRSRCHISSPISYMASQENVPRFDGVWARKKEGLLEIEVYRFREHYMPSEHEITFRTPLTAVYVQGALIAEILHPVDDPASEDQAQGFVYGLQSGLAQACNWSFVPEVRGYHVFGLEGKTVSSAPEYARDWWTLINNKELVSAVSSVALPELFRHTHRMWLQSEVDIDNLVSV